MLYSSRPSFHILGVSLNSNYYSAKPFSVHFKKGWDPPVIITPPLLLPPRVPAQPAAAMWHTAIGDCRCLLLCQPATQPTPALAHSRRAAPTRPSRPELARRADGVHRQPRVVPQPVERVKPRNSPQPLAQPHLPTSRPTCPLLVISALSLPLAARRREAVRRHPCVNEVQRRGHAIARFHPPIASPAREPPSQPAHEANQ